MAAAPLSLREFVRAIRPLAAWAHHHTGGGPPPSRLAANLTDYAFSEDALLAARGLWRAVAAVGLGG